MRIITTRRISQIFFFALFAWFCGVATLGERWWQLRGWPINWFLQLDPLSGLGLLLATHTIYAGLLWGVVTLVLTLFLGRFFCGWLCPFGAWQQFVGYLGKRGVPAARRIARNRPHPGQAIKYWLLLGILAAAAADLIHSLLRGVLQQPMLFGLWLALAIVGAIGLATARVIRVRAAWVTAGAAALAAGLLVELLVPHNRWLATSLQTGLLDPIALMQRSVNLVLLPLADGPLKVVSTAPRSYPGTALIGTLFLLFTLLCLRVPRFYCRFVCPTGALLGLLSRWSVWRIGKKVHRCADCRQCERDCEGACAPAEAVRTSECVLCLNCLDQCRHDMLAYHAGPSADGESATPDITRRQVLTSLAVGLAAVPMLRLEGATAAGWNPAVIRPPGALAEADFLTRCIKCGQCMRICPTNVIHPAGLQSGFEGLWTPMLDFRVSTSGCQHNCVACSHVCPTAALRPLSVDERLGRGSFAAAGPLRLGMAFVDHGRCLPWAMDTPCIVCQENCPVSPKAIFTRGLYQPVRDGRRTIRAVEGRRVVLAGTDLVSGQYATGDFFCRGNPEQAIPITANDHEAIVLGDTAVDVPLPTAGDTLDILIRLQQPCVDPRRCIGCGVCEHECPVQGQRAIRVTAENESRAKSHTLIIPK
jgi:polyferredoxin/ferredoxin